MKSFIVPARRDRYVEFLSTPKRRKKLIALLPHFKHLDPRYAHDIPKGVHGVAAVHELLTSMGAESQCWIVSEMSDLDGRMMDLKTALEEVYGGRMGTFLSCVPGKLAYFEDEDHRFILRR